MSRRHLKALFWGCSPVAVFTLALYLAVDDSPYWVIALLAFLLFMQLVRLGMIIAAIALERRGKDTPN